MLRRRPFLAMLLSTLPFAGRWVRAADQAAEPEKPAFTEGEKLKYTLGWQFIVAGYATLEVLPDEEFEGEVLRCFEMKARTRSVMDHMYRVRDNLSSTTDRKVTRSMGYAKIQREGKIKRDVTVDFDWDNLNAHYFEALSGDVRVTPIKENTLDPLSALYYIRNQKMKVGSVISGPMTDGKRCKIARITVVKRETIKVNGRKYDTLKLIPDIQDLGGVFEKSKGAKVEIWCTADHRHIPVLMKSKVMVGSFRAELESAI